MDGDHGALVERGAAGDARRLRLPAHQCQVEAAVAQAGDALLRVHVALELHRDAGLAAVRLRDEAGGDAVRGQGAQAQAHPAHVAGRGHGDRPLGGLRRLEQLPGRTQQGLACGRERDVPGGAVEEIRSQLLLELTDRTTERRLGDAEAICRTTEVQFLCDREECTHLLELHESDYGRLMPSW